MESNTRFTRNKRRKLKRTTRSDSGWTVTIDVSPEFVSKKPTVAIDHRMQSMLLDELKCAICLELFRQPKILSCGHCFCANCLEQWNQESSSCPICMCYYHKRKPYNCYLLERIVEIMQLVDDN